MSQLFRPMILLAAVTLSASVSAFADNGAFVDRQIRIAPPPAVAPATAPGNSASGSPAPDSPAPTVSGPVTPLDRIVAVVNKDIITNSDLNNRMDMVMSRLKSQNPQQLPPREVLRKQVLERMILERIQLQLAERTGIRVDDDTVDRAIENIAKQNHMDVEQFRAAMSRQGIAYGPYRQEIRDQIILERLARREVEGHLTVTAEEENAFAKQAGQQWGKSFDLQHIFIAIPENASPAQVAERKARAEVIRARLEQGEDFAQAAIAESNGQHALQGGRIGVKRAGELSPDFVKVFDGMQVGQISPVLRSSGGFHIFKLLDKKVGKPTVTEVHARHILLSAQNPEQMAAAERRANEIEKQLRQGKDFAVLAKEYSQDAGSAQKGGDIGWVRPGETVPSFERALFALKPGEISPPIQSRFGVHIIQALDTREREVDEKDIKQAARAQLLNRKGEEKMEQWLRELRDEAYVRILDPALRGTPS